MLHENSALAQQQINTILKGKIPANWDEPGHPSFVQAHAVARTIWECSKAQLTVQARVDENEIKGRAVDLLPKVLERIALAKREAALLQEPLEHDPVAPADQT